jgi:hypothetical protein
MTTNDDGWLQRLRVGDSVYVASRWSGLHPAKVTKLTRTQIVCDNDSRFYIKDGYSVGGGPWHRSYLSEANEANETAYAHQAGLAYLGCVSWSYLHRGDAIEIARQVREMVERRKAADGNQDADAKRAVTPAASAAPEKITT